MPFKTNADRRHHISKQKHRVTNWTEYDAGLRARGSLTVWFTPEAIDAWRAKPRTGRGGQPTYSALAIATDADTGQIVASVLTDRDAADGSQVCPLLDRVDGSVAALIGDGAYDRDDVYTEVATHHPDAAVTAPTQRDAHLRCIAERGRMGWQRASGYNWRALVEADISRWKRVIGDGL
ncbi:transposase [Belnapia moabensis]|uniref:transposase n=1 Tax=Belnapia moabensis TaxID=365533 RepID=UPI0038CD6AE5